MVSLLEEIYSFSDIRPQIDAKFKLSQLMKKHSVALDGDKHQNLLESAIQSQSMNNASSVRR